MSNVSPHDVTTLFLSLGTLLAAARLFGEAFARFGQPAVVGEILTGVVLGKTVLGRFLPEAHVALYPAAGPVAAAFDGLSILAICLFLLVAGMEVQLSAVWRRGRAAVGVSLAGFILPFGIGWVAASVAPFALGCEADADPKIFTFFFATAIAISALPVIAKTLMDLGLYRSDFGTIVIASAVFDDLVGWLVFAVILAMMGNPAAHGMGPIGTALMTIGFAVATLTAGRALVRPALRWVQGCTSWPGGVLGFVMALALLGASLTEWIGVHAIFGSFLVGVIVGDSPDLKEEARRILVSFVSSLFAPLFFAAVALHVDFAVNFDPLLVGVVLVVACLAKILACGWTSRWTGLDARTAWAVGFALNARGAMEIVLGTLALRNGLIRPRMFVALVTMAVVTSMMAGPMIQRLLGRSRERQSASDGAGGPSDSIV